MISSTKACYDFLPQPLSRRAMLRQSAVGFGGLALHALLAEGVRAESRATAPLVARPPRLRARAKRVIFCFMHGGPSQVDTFDYKPRLERDHGKPFPGKMPRIVSSKTGNLLASPFGWKRYGEAGIPVSDLFPEIGAVIDKVSVVNSMHGTNSRHGGALLELHTGSDTFVRPSLGSWIAYGLGSENENLPAFLTICPTLGHGGVNAWSSAFLPAHYQGTPIGSSRVKAEKAKLPFIENGGRVSRASQRRELDFLAELNRDHLLRRGPDDALEARIESFELAFRMQREAPLVQDLSGESAATKKLYGIDEGVTRNFGLQCLLARRFAQAGVRFIQVTHSYKWDQHGGLRAQHTRNAREVDRPLAGLLRDLESHGLLDDTLVVWGGEFGRTPTAQGKDGRDHNPHAASFWLAGGGVKGGIRFGKTDDHGYYSVEDKVHFHDLHATILHLLGLDHERLTYRYAGRDFRLTDVHGRVVDGLLA